jgi:glucans biosynthesis protein C
MSAATRPTASSPSSLALDNLRAVVILIVLGFHSALAYLQWNQTKPAPFDAPPFAWRAFPVIDSHRFFPFDLLCAWQDVYLMSLLFFLSGLFAWPSLVRKSEWRFLRGRLLRLGLPYVSGVLIIIPAAIYPAFRLGGGHGLEDYPSTLYALPFWPNGPLWFLWQLLALNIVAAFAHRFAPGAVRRLGRWSMAAAKQPGQYFAALAAASALAYVPMALAFTPWAWSDTGPLAFQLSRPLLYAAFFFAGIGVGMDGVEDGLVAVDGPLARHWLRWLTAGLTTLLLWMGLTSLTLDGHASKPVEIAAYLSFAPACVAGCFALIGTSLHFVTRRSPILSSLAANAYSLYLIHYVFIVWLQYALLTLPLSALIKAPLVFAGTLIFSWTGVAAIRQVPFGALLIGSTPRQLATAAQ